MPNPTSSTSSRLAMAQWIVNVEARRDKAGRLRVYMLPKGDGGGTYEIAGINDKYHPEIAAKLRTYLDWNKFAEAEALAVEHIAQCTDVVATWCREPGIEFFLRDCAFNRGARGAAMILQGALNVARDGRVGPVTRKALAVFTPPKRPSYTVRLLSFLRAERERYERRVAPPEGDRAKFWRGLVNRWDAAHAEALRWNA
mgnify:CR=1 FL=1